MTAHCWSFDEYLAYDAVSSSMLATIALKSPFDWKEGNVVETDSMRLGTAAHCLTLEPERFADRCAVWTQRNDKGKIIKRDRRIKLWREFDDEHAGKTKLLPDQHASAKAQAQAVHDDERAAPLVSGGIAEMTIVVEMGGTLVKVRPDYLTPRACVELKGVNETQPRKLWQMAWDRGWPVKGALYRDALYAHDGIDREFWFIVVRNNPPYKANALMMPDDFYQDGRDFYQDALVTLAECRRTGVWPGPLDEYMHIELPGWRKAERRREQGIAELLA